MHANADIVCSSPALRRSLYLVSLVLEDPGAGVHNARFSRQLLAEAEELLGVR
jgi:hypothetical protein